MRPTEDEDRPRVVTVLSTADLGRGRTIVVELRERRGERYLKLALCVDGAPTAVAIYAQPDQLQSLRAALDLALTRLEGWPG